MNFIEPALFALTLSQTIYNSTIKDRLKLLLNLRYGLDNGKFYTLEEIGSVLNVTRERVRQLELKAVRSLRGVGLRQIRKEQTTEDCARLVLYLTEQIKPKTPQDLNRLIEFSQEALSFLPLPMSVSLIMRLVGYTVPTVKEYQLQIRRIENIAIKKVRTFDQFSTLLRSIVWPRGQSCCEFSKVSNMKPTRKVNSYENSGSFYSQKLERLVQYESFLERDFYLKLENHPDVSFYCEQPFAISYQVLENVPKLKKGLHNYYPDVFFLTTANLGVVVEIKPIHHMALKKNLIKWNALEKYCAVAGWGLLITDGRRIVQQLENYPIRSNFEDAVLQSLNNQPNLNWANYKILRDTYQPLWSEFLALIIRNGLVWSIKPFLLTKNNP